MVDLGYYLPAHLHAPATALMKKLPKDGSMLKLTGADARLARQLVAASLLVEDVHGASSFGLSDHIRGGL